MTNAHVVWTLDNGQTVEFNANLTIKVVPATPPAAVSTGGGDLTFTRREGPPLDLLPRRQRFEVARFPNGSTLVREVPMDEEQP